MPCSADIEPRKLAFTAHEHTGGEDDRSGQLTNNLIDEWFQGILDLLRIFVSNDVQVEVPFV